MAQAPLVTLLTDFGLADGYVGTMKGVILGIAPGARLVDISHEIAVQGVRQAAYVLYATYRFFPLHTVHLVVVDPGVGSARRSIALRTSSGVFVGPDNGVFGYVMQREPVEAVVELTQPRYQLSPVSHTFHGRDIFAPAAAYLAAGTPIAELGPPVSDPILLPLPVLKVVGEAIVGEVMHIDRFGNVITSVGELYWEQGGLLLRSAFGQVDETRRISAAEVEVIVAGWESAGVRRTYAEVETGDMLALVGSSGHLEIAVRDGSAAERLGVHLGDEIIVRPACS
jgi:S-adenosylmethionine hydrolase